MEFIKKNYGLVLFLVLCLGVLIFQLIGILGVQKRREANQKVRAEHLERLKKVKSANLRIDAENQELADAVAEKAKSAYLTFGKHLWEKRLLPGVDFSDEALEAAASGTASPAVDEDGNPKVDPYKNLPNRVRFDKWMTGTLIDAREKLLNELNTLNRNSFKVQEVEASAQAGGEGQPGAAAAPKRPAREQGGGARDASGQQLSKIVKGAAISPYFMFSEYVEKRENGLKQLERHKVFRQFLLLEYIVNLLRVAEVDSLDAIDFPCGLEILDGDQYTTTPVTLSITGKPECVESFLNLLNANEHYFFYLQDITSFDGTVQLNDDSTLPFNSRSDGSGGPRLLSYLNSVGISTDAVMSGAGAGGLGTGGAGAGVTGAGGAGYGGETMAARPGAMNPGAMDMGGTADGGQLQMQVLPRTRKSYRVFAKKQEEEASSSMDGLLVQKRQSNATEYGTRVSVSLNFEYVEFKPISE